MFGENGDRLVMVFCNKCGKPFKTRGPGKGIEIKICGGKIYFIITFTCPECGAIYETTILQENVKNIEVLTDGKRRK